MRARPSRVCPHCLASLRWLETDCPACGKPTAQRLPWYGWVLGGVLVLLLFLALADFGALARFIAGLAARFRR
jgi:hypothetical protein